MQMLLPSFSLGSSSSANPYGKFYHAQGSKKYSNELHKATGLYKTTRPGGKALAREEDVPGMSPFNKSRPMFHETGVVPDSLSDEQLSHFRYTANGSTYPTVGNVNGKNYIVKHGYLPEGVRKNADLNDHLAKEVAADRLIREAGLNAPVCKTFERVIPKEKSVVDEKKLSDLFDLVSVYKIAKNQYEQVKADGNATQNEVKEAKRIKEMLNDAVEKFRKSLGKDYDAYKEELKDRVVGGVLQPKKPIPEKELVKIAEYVDGGVSLVKSWFQGTKEQKAKIRQQVIDAYPVMSFLENVDAFKNDNVLVDKGSNLWFIDNGASFDYRAQGGKKLISEDDRMATSRSKNPKPWYYERKDPTDFTTGYLGLAYAPDQKLLQEILSDVKDSELVEAAKKYNFGKLVKTLPDDVRKPGLVEYAKKLDEAVRNPPKDWLQD